MYNIVAAIDPDTDEFLGFSGSDYRSGHPCDLLPVAWDLDLIVENENGTHSLNLENNSKIKDVIDKYAALASLNASRGSWYAMRDFANGNTLFAKGSFYNPYGEDAMLREMSDQHSFLPWPKYDTNQTEYYTTSQDYYTLLTVIDHSESTRKTQGIAVSAYLQLLTEVSNESVLPLYRKSRVEKNSNIPNMENAYKMYDLIVGSITYDFRTIYSPQLNNITWLWRDYMNSYDDMMARYLDKKEAYETAVYDTDLWLGLASLAR
jgi:hypothetical protein